MAFGCAVLGIVGAIVCPSPAEAVGWAEGCLPFLAPAEQYYHLPAGLLHAIALTESGQGGEPYPWALNIGGQPVIAPSYQAAAGLLRQADGRPRRDVAIGCMQIHMQYHLTRFIEPEWALHPQYNVWYAALYLDALRRQYGDILSAVAHYHASDRAAQRSYLCRVAFHLEQTSPTTRRALGLDNCEQTVIVGGPAHAKTGITGARQARATLMEARRIGRIIVLGGDRR
ncbi:transglycosylase SLT domain-containing protein [Telmatospirillum sp.]|uniref:transglycosylase SLT domain-containing protein n=1 Tax=Telmatospirillum sp. TaxID=2079197 RepID=UPI0028422A06|nr:transglycosylase SLT domain-containing protein [Telmatospirillum sp.]MDR3439229.1 transglycosylase SLT domain-containing protein [Telmatospirillum sp.]